jgi:phosphatidylglycerol:prolipoprotein diacylglycerol transferase
MRPVLLQLPSKLLFVLALALAVVTFVHDRARRRKDPKAPASSNTLYLVAGAWALLAFRGGSWVPTPAAFSHPWLPVPIHSYGVMLGTSMIVGWFLAMRLAREDGVPEEQAGAIYMWTAVWSIVGARILYVIANHGEFDSFFDIFKVWNGGLVAYGGMIGGFLASWYGCHKRGIALLRWADCSAPSVVLGTAITRIGCLLYGCDYGRKTDVGWAIRFPKAPPLGAPPSPAWLDHHQNLGLPTDAAYSFPVHPTQLYELLAGLFLFGLLMYLRRVRKFSGEVFLGWVLGYGILRPLIEIYRDDKQRGSVGPLSTSQFIGMISVVLGVGLLVHLIRRYRANPEGSRLWELPLVTPAAAAAPASRGQRRRRGAR